MCPIVENKLNIMLIADTSVLCHIFRIVFISTYVQHNTSKTICEPFKITHELWEIFLAVLNRIGQSDQQMGKIMLQKKLWVNLKKKLVIFLWINTVTGVTVFCSLSLFFLFFPREAAFVLGHDLPLCTVCSHFSPLPLTLRELEYWRSLGGLAEWRSDHFQLKKSILGGLFIVSSILRLKKHTIHF